MECCNENQNEVHGIVDEKWVNRYDDSSLSFSLDKKEMRKVLDGKEAQGWVRVFYLYFIF